MSGSPIAGNAPAIRVYNAVTLIAVIGGLLAVVLRVYYVLHAQVLQPLDDPQVRADAADYYRYAWNLLHHAAFANDVPASPQLHPNSFRDPGYAVFLAGLMAATSNYASWYAAVLLTQALLGGITVSLLVLAARDFLPPTALAVAALAMALWPHSVAMPSFVLSETLLSFVCALGILGVYFLLRRPTFWRLVGTGLIISGASMTNAVLLPFGVALACMLLVRRHLDGRAAATLALVSLLLPAAWGVRAFTLPPSDSSVHRAAMNLVQGSWPTYHAAYQLAMKGDGDGIRTINAIDSEVALFQVSTFTGLSTLANRFEHAPLTYASWYASKPALLWDWDIRIGQGDIYVYPTRNSPFRENPAWKAVEAACFLANPILMMLALAGTVSAVARRESESIHVALATMIATVTLIYSILQAEPRYSNAFRGTEILLATIGTIDIWRFLGDIRAGSRDSHSSS
ncbi:MULTISPECIES: hypothetical protein [unclassified Luteibacter]|uniref:hypothetical protein n=1 Tax=Luteibacter sp. PvP019 TaxID=3156436 RepID=UPI003391CA61